MLKKKFENYLYYALPAIALYFLLHSLYIKDYNYTTFALLAFVPTLVPFALKRKFKMNLPWLVTLFIAVAFLFHVVGNVFGYNRLFYPVYDKIAHLISSMAIAILAFFSAIILDRYAIIKMDSRAILLSVINLTMILGIFWEIGEFLSDHFLGMQTQLSSTDTAWDLIFDLVGCSTVGAIGYIYLKKKPKEDLFMDFLSKS
ncbi:MAG TPA: hypothetical protein HA346_03740 [Thermoplasmata archaeon]|nr:hypothetical protein [Thermoplasmata archaeon]